MTTPGAAEVLANDVGRQRQGPLHVVAVVLARHRAPGHVRHVATDARLVRRGVGRAVMAAVMEDAAEAGCRCLQCLSTLTAEPFYRALGFRRLRAVTLTFGAPIAFPAIEMEREL